MLQGTVRKNVKFTIAGIFFREITSLVTSLAKTLLSRIFCQKCVRLNRSNFHTVCSILWHSVEKRNIYSRQINSLVFSVVKTLLSRIFCQRRMIVNFCNFHTVLYLPVFFLSVLIFLSFALNFFWSFSHFFLSFGKAIDFPVFSWKISWIFNQILCLTLLLVVL